MTTTSVNGPATGPGYAEPLTLGAEMALAIRDRDASRLCSLFATPVVFRAVTPRRFWDAETPMGIADIALGVWFDESKTITGLTVLETDTVGDVEKVSYRMSVELDSGRTEIEQVAYYSHADGQITQMRLVCSGFRPV
jgi:hypothetical protein